jgi:ketosteroid isomerase-like protein
MAMSSDGVETVRAALACLNDGDIDGLISYCDDDFDLDMSDRVFNPDTYRGHDGIRRFYGEVSDVWEEFRWEPTRFVDATDAVVVLLHSRGRGRGSGIEMARDAAMVWTVREGRALSLRFYIDQAEALKAAGVEQ